MGKLGSKEALNCFSCCCLQHGRNDHMFACLLKNLKRESEDAVDGGNYRRSGGLIREEEKECSF